MSRRKTIAIALAAVSVGASGLLATPAFAATSGATDVTFVVSGGSGLAISIPSNTTVDLGSATSNILGTTVTGSLHPTTVTDTRGAILGSWTVTVSSPGFTGSGTAAGQTLAPGNATMYLDTVTTLTGVLGLATGGLVPTSAAFQLTPATLSSGGATLLAGTTAGSGSITYTPDIHVAIPANTAAGTYTGTVTQTVS
jgi:hypothetical protein